MLVDVVMPKMGESIMEGKILRWTKKVGETIQKDETILEISTDKVDSEIPSPVEGKLASIVVQEQETVPVGTVIAKVETDAAAAIETAAATAAVPAAETTGESPAPAEPTQGQSHPQTAPIGRGSGKRFYSPLVRTISRKEGITTGELDGIQGSGAGGRVNKSDVLAYLKTRGTGAGRVSRAEYTIAKADIGELQKKYPAPRHEILQMDNVQQKMAEHMVRSVATSPHVQAIDEIDVSRIVAYRSQHAAEFERTEGFKLTYTPFFLYSVVNALKQYPLVNAALEGDKIIVKKFINLGMAVASPTGLIVPNIRSAEEKSFLGLSRAINDIAVRTRTRKLQPDEIMGGTFTVTNYGVFGNIIGVPIINQPQVAILGIGAIKKRPMVITDQDGQDMIGIRSMVYFTLSFDHRILDGAIGGEFLAAVKRGVEDFDFSRIS